MDSFGNGWVSPLQDQETPHMDLVGEMQDGGFEPQARARSNTWPCPRPTEESESTKVINQQLVNVDSQQASHNIGSSKKNSSRRNAWGNLSYADLITHAIGSATEKRLTLSQIYEWMVQNVPYFKDKGDSNSSAGWKNSIRHNLSLHNRFMRVQNEGTGKSSWWMLNPDAKPGKSVRRRAASMETSRYEKRRGRAKKRVEALRNAGFTGLHDATPSPSSSVSEGLDHFSESPLHSGGFQLSPDFRQRASSNASSCGRLSPIPALVGLELDWSFKVDYQNTNVASAQSIALDQLAGSIRDDLSLQKDILQGFSAAPVTVSQPSTTYDPPQPYSINTAAIQSYGMQQNQCHLHRTLTCACLENKREGLSPSSGSEISSAYPNIDPPSDSLLTYGIVMESSGILTNDNANLVEQQQTQEQQSFISNLEANCALTSIGQCMETSNNQTQSDEFNIDNFQGGLECNIEELLQQEMSIDGLLDINIPLTAAVTTTAANRSTHLQPNQPSNNNAISTTLDLPQNETGTSHTRVQYSQSSVTPPSWVH